MARSETDAEDIVQEALIRAWRTAGSRRADPLPWILATTRREAYRRDSARREELVAEADDDVCSADEFEALTDRLDFEALLAELAAGEPLLLELRYRDDLTQPAKAMGMPEGTTKVRHHRAALGVAACPRRLIMAKIKKNPAKKTRPKKSGAPTKPASPARGRAKRVRKPVTPDPKLVKALAHPLRMRMLARLNEATRSPAELAREFEISIPLASYHVTTLRELDCIELVSTTPVRGSTEHHYRATRRAYLSDREWAAVDIDIRQSITGAVIRDAVSDALAALQSGDMDRRDDRHVSFSSLDLDEEGWAEVNGLLEAVLERALRLQAECAARQLGEDRPDPIRSRLTLLHYEPVPERPSTGVAEVQRKRPSDSSKG